MTLDMAKGDSVTPFLPLGWAGPPCAATEAQHQVQSRLLASKAAPRFWLPGPPSGCCSR